MTTPRRQCGWVGASGTAYLYDVYDINTNWDDSGANYIFANLSSPIEWTPVYIGQTRSLRDRLPNDNELPCIRRNGGSHVHIHHNSSEQTRLAEEKDLLARHQTPCNS